jgi:hypothetical protein
VVLGDIAGEDAAGLPSADCCDVGIEIEMDEGGEGTASTVELSIGATELSCIDVCRGLEDAEAT